MASISWPESEQKPHAVCFPGATQGHITPMLNLAKLLHHKGFHITFVNTEFNHNRLLKSRGPDALNGLSSFQFKTIPDGLPPSDPDATQDIPSICKSTSTYCIGPFRGLIAELNDGSARSSGRRVPPVSCIVADAVMTFTFDAAEELGIPEVLLWTASACSYLGYVHYADLIAKGLTPLKAAEELGVPQVLVWTASACSCLGYMHYSDLIDKGLTPLKDESYLTNGYLEQTVDWIPGMKGIRLRDLPTFIRTTDPDDYMVKFFVRETARAKKASAIVINTYEELEVEAINALSSILPPIYSIGPLHLLEQQINDDNLAELRSNLWKEETECLQWLDTRDPNSVVYVNFGSITVMTPDQLVEFAWGLANSKVAFLWIIRPDLVSGNSSILPPDFLEDTESRGMLASWCPQEQVLKHPSIGGFLTHIGWNSCLESISTGVPMICWPFFADQQTNCWYCCTQWGIGMEIDNNVKRDEVESLVRELMVGEKGKEMKKNALQWKNKAEEAAKSPSGSSSSNLEKVIKVIHSK